MTGHLPELLRGHDPLEGRNVLREYLQARILETLERVGAMSALAFQGGTALRFLYGLPRYSEDLDFALEGARDSYDLGGWLTEIVRRLRREDYEVTASLRNRGNVHAAWVRFRGLLHTTGLSPHRGQVLAVKVDVDTHPPRGAVTETRLVRRHVALRIHHHDPASLFAGKLHAVLCRPWTKGRDIYDLAWYLADPSWPQPNLSLLNAALSQSGAAAESVTSANWRRIVADRIAALSWDVVAADVRPFLTRADDVPARREVLSLLDALD